MEISVEPQMASRFCPQRYFENQQGEKIPAPESFKSKCTSEAKKRKGCSPHPPSTPPVPPGVAAEPPSFPWSAVGNLLFPVQHTLSISKCSLKTNFQDLPEGPQKVCRPLWC